ncbi:MAG TPA: hypothetical protein VGN11_12730, partial [Candidatus Baltobacteraceae bacterium]|nr:hypothetical protein [Candidatus Baltobacteraceae bacterium]
MKKIGIVGGLAWPSTVEYYSELCRRAKRCDASGGLEINIESLDLAKSVSYFGVDGDEVSW